MSVRSLVGDVVEDVRSVYPEATVGADLPDRATVIGTPTIAQAVHELLENAVTHHPGPPSTIGLAVSVTRERDTVQDRVGDNGPAIPESEVAPILLGEESPLAHTSGVGLWLVAWVTRTFDGTVDFDPGPDGNVVTLTFTRDLGDERSRP